jgi:DNA-binding HxlR family transcriptional regulator
MAGKREYGEACPVAHSLDIVGDRWALLVVRELRLGPKRFSDLQASLPRAGPNVLAARLRQLTESGVLVRRRLPPPAGSPVYQLTQWGAELEPVFEALARWGMRSPVVKREGRLTADSVMLAVRSFFRPTDQPFTATYEFRLDADVYRLRVIDGQLAELSRGEAGQPDARIAGDRMAVHELIETGTAPDNVTITGDQSAVQRLLTAVRIPSDAG